MFVRVYPFLRLPRRFGVFDYVVPEGLAPAVGDLVRVPFHGREVLGVVAACAEATEVRSKVSTVIDTVQANAMTEGDVARLVTLAVSIAQSPATIFASAFGVSTGENAAPKWLSRPQKALSLSRDIADVITATLTQSAGERAVVCQLPTDGAFALAQTWRPRVAEQMLIIVPRERDTELLGALIDLGLHAAVLHGHTSPKERERILRAWRQGTLRTLVGTLQATLLPAEKLGAVLVISTGTDDHFPDRRNPRLDNRLAAAAQAEQHGAKLILTDVLPRPEEIAAFPTACFATPVAPNIVDIRKPEESTDYALLSETLIAEMKKALQSQKKVLLFYNRKGLAKRVQCRNCGAVATCPDCGSIPAIRPPLAHCLRCGRVDAIPETCTGCTHGRMSLKGIGNAHVEKDLALLFPGSTIGRIEKGHADALGADILLVTEYYFSSLIRPFAAKTFGLVADLAIDLSLNPENFRAQEDTARKLHRLCALGKQQGAQTLVQTWLPEAIEPMRDAKTFLEGESATRRQYGLPPFAAQVTVRHADADAMAAITEYRFIPDPEILGAIGRIPYPALVNCLRSLGTLPDTAVISLDQTYVHTDRAPQSES